MWGGGKTSWVYIGFGVTQGKNWIKYKILLDKVKGFGIFLCLSGKKWGKVVWFTQKGG
jgi:hypothetical protein